MTRTKRMAVRLVAVATLLAYGIALALTRDQFFVWHWLSGR